jgi:CAI-1 autoinducer synthase
MKHGSKGNIKDWESSQLKAKIESHFNRVKYGNPLIGPFKPDSSSINLMSNDYLCLGDNEQIKEAIKNSITYSKSAPLMSAVYLNSASPQAKIEKALAKFSDFEDAILCQSGYVANVGLLEVVLDSEKPVYIDKFAHHSFMQGCLAAKVTPYVFNHNNLIHLKELIEIHGSGHILVDSIYSSIGSLCDLESVCNLADHYGCSVIVDESHSLGVFGKSGKGLVYHLGLSKRVEFITASLSKAFAGRAGLILGSKRNCETIRYNSSPAIFSSSL